MNKISCAAQGLSAGEEHLDQARHLSSSVVATVIRWETALAAVGWDESH